MAENDSPPSAPDAGELARTLTDAFNRCNLWPEQGWPEGMVNASYMALLEIRNAVPQIAALLLKLAETEKQLAEALKDPPYEEYKSLVRAVANLAMDEPLPPREVPLAFITTLLSWRRAALRSAASITTPLEGSGKP
jgi:hypothetical protein